MLNKDLTWFLQSLSWVHRQNRVALLAGCKWNVFNLDLKREILAALCILLFSELKNLGPWNLIPKNPNSNLTRNEVDKEPLSACATFKQNCYLFPLNWHYDFELTIIIYNKGIELLDSSQKIILILSVIITDKIKIIFWLESSNSIPIQLALKVRRSIYKRT